MALAHLSPSRRQSAHAPATRLILGGLGGACAVMSLRMIFSPAKAVRGKVEAAAYAKYGADNPLLDCYTVWAGFFFLCLSVVILMARNMPRMACKDLFAVMAVLWSTWSTELQPIEISGKRCSSWRWLKVLSLLRCGGKASASRTSFPALPWGSMRHE